MDRKPGLVYPTGVNIPIELPPFSIINCPTKRQQDIAVNKVAALNTGFFPVLRQQIFDDINRRLEAFCNV